MTERNAEGTEDAGDAGTRGSRDGPARITPASVVSLAGLSLGAFCYVSTETLPIGLLPLISADLGESLSGVGLLITGYGLTVAAFSLPLAYVTRRLPRRGLLVSQLGVFVLTTILSAAANGFGMIMAARIMTALSQAIFWAIVIPTAVALFPWRIRGRVISIVFVGASLGPMLGVPAGAWLGHTMGWRAAFLMHAAMGLLAFCAIWSLLPPITIAQRQAISGNASNWPRYLLLSGATIAAIAGLYSTFTYTAPYLTDIGKFSDASIGPLLFLRGAFVVAGISVGGFLADRYGPAVLCGSLAMMATSLVGTYATSAQLPLSAFLALSGFALGTLTPALASRVLEAAPGDADFASAGNSMAFNVGIAGGSLIGGLILTGAGLRTTPLIGGILVVAALATALAEWIMVAFRDNKKIRHLAVLPDVPDVPDAPSVPTARLREP
jgi:MFS transporter, DHA1 family, inner membrane transport protein